MSYLIVCDITHDVIITSSSLCYLDSNEVEAALCCQGSGYHCLAAARRAIQEDPLGRGNAESSKGLSEEEDMGREGGSKKDGGLGGRIFSISEPPTISPSHFSLPPSLLLSPPSPSPLTLLSPSISLSLPTEASQLAYLWVFQRPLHRLSQSLLHIFLPTNI